MKTYNLLFVLGLAVMPMASFGASACSRMNLTRCLDSVCAINIGANPAARCQYCGTANAGAPKASNMRTVSTGTSAKYTLTEKELKSAPTDPGERYAWATAQCLTRVAGCTTDDVEEEYDKLIEQSCRAAGIDAQMSALHAAARATKSESQCRNDITACVAADTRCGADWMACKNDADFDNFFSACGVQVGGCNDFMAPLRTSLMSARDAVFANADAIVQNIVASYRATREQRLASVTESCRTGATYDACVANVCAQNMRHNCAPEYPNEKSMATQLCRYYELACNLLK